MVDSPLTQSCQDENGMDRDRALLLELFDLSPDGILISDSQGIVINANPCICKFLGDAPKELIGTAIADLFAFSGGDRDTENNNIETGSVLPSNGRPIPVEITTKPLSNGYWATFVRPLADFSDKIGQLKTQVELINVELVDNEHGDLTTGIIGWKDNSDRYSAEIKIQPSEQQLRRILDSLFSFVGVLTPDGILIEANRTALEAARLQPSDVLGKPFPEAYWWSFLPESQTQLRAAIRRAAAGEIVRYDAQVRLASDRFVIIDFALVPLFDAAGQVEYLIPSGMDITDRKQAEAALQQSKEIVRQQLIEIESIYTSAPIGLCFIDTNLHFIRINERLAEINGLPVCEHVGRSLREVLPEMADQLEPLYRQVIQTGEPILNLEVRGSSRAQPELERDWLVCYHPQTSADGRVVGVNVMVQEITERKQAELALREAHIQLASALAAGSIYTWRWEISHNRVVTDRNFARLFGVDPENATVGLPIEHFVNAMHPDDRPRVSAAIEQAIATGADYAVEYRVRSNTGQYRWVLARGRVEYDEHGNPLQFPGALADISDRKLGELNDQFLTELDLRLRQLADADAMVWETVRSLGEYLNVDRCLWHTVDLPAGTTTVQQDWRRQTDLASVTGTYRLSEYILPEMINQYHAGQPVVIADVTTHNYTASVAANFIQHDIRAILAAPRIEAGRWVATFAVNSRTVRQWRADEVALLQEVMARLWSLIEQTRAVQTLREREDRYRTLFESVDQGFCICQMILDATGTPYDYRFLEINPAFEAMTGLEQATHKTARELVPNLESFWFETYGRVVLTGIPARFENHSEVMHRWFDVQAFRVGHPQNHRFGILFTNITERKLAEAERERLLVQERAARQEAERTNRLKDDFFSALSHELRTPLNPILGWTKLLQGRRLTPDKVAQALETIERNVKHQISLVDDLLDVSRMIQGKLRLNSHPVDLALILNTVIETGKFAAQAKAITVQFNAPDAIYTLGDGDRLGQVFWNLLSNAIKFTPQGGQVDIELGISQRDANRYAQVRITDSGIGIEPEFLPHIFEYFRQAEGGSTRSYGGLGLGLAIVRHFVELHGGMVTVDSPGLGQGATFTVLLPIRVDLNPDLSSPTNQPTSSSASSSSASSSSDSKNSEAITPAFASGDWATSPGSQRGLGGVSILIVDDEPDNLELLRFLLSEEGATVMAFTSAKEALQAIAQSPPQLIMSDIGMPEMDGYRFLHQVRALPSQQRKPTPAIALTAYAQPADREQAIAAGFQAYFSKPINLLEVIPTVAQLASCCLHLPFPYSTPESD